MWANRKVIFSRHQQHGQNFVQAPKAAGINLQNINGTTRDELLEHHTVVAHLSRSHLNWGDIIANNAVSLNVIW